MKKLAKSLTVISCLLILFAAWFEIVHGEDKSDKEWADIRKLRDDNDQLFNKVRSAIKKKNAITCELWPSGSKLPLLGMYSESPWVATAESCTAITHYPVYLCSDKSIAPGSPWMVGGYISPNYSAEKSDTQFRNPTHWLTLKSDIKDSTCVFDFNGMTFGREHDYYWAASLAK